MREKEDPREEQKQQVVSLCDGRIGVVEELGGRL